MYSRNRTTNTDLENIIKVYNVQNSALHELDSDSKLKQKELKQAVILDGTAIVKPIPVAMHPGESENVKCIQEPKNVEPKV
jgi:hypothetical protein